MQTDRRAGTVILVANRSPEATVTQDIEGHGLVARWVRTIGAAVELLKSTSEQVIVVTDLALADGNWSDLVERVRCIEASYPIFLMTGCITAELWWDALDCGVEDILPGHLMAARLCQFLETRDTISSNTSPSSNTNQ